jgi:WHG domain-containing protein
VRRRLGARGARELADALGRAAVGRAGRDALHALAHAYRAYAREHPGSYAAAQRARELAQDEEAAEAAAAAADVVLAVLRGYDLRDDAAIHAARTIRATLHGFVSLEAIGGFAIETPIDATFDALIDTLDHGLRAHAGSRNAATTPRRSRRR